MNRKVHLRTHVQGESLEQEIRNLMQDYNLELLLPTLLAVLVAYCWLIFAGIITLNFGALFLLTMILVFVVVRAVIRMRRILRKIRCYRKGLDGERYVGSLLEKMTSESTFVFHDIIRYKTDKPDEILFNIDHVIVSTKGIFAVDTKNWSHADRDYDKADYIFDNGELIDSTGVVRNTVIDRLNSEAQFLESKIKEWIGVQYSVKRVGVLIGAYVQNVQGDFSRFWFVNESAFAPLYEKARDEVPLQDVLRISDNLRRYAEKPIK